MVGRLLLLACCLLAAGWGLAAQDGDLVLRNFVEPARPYVQSQVRLTQRLIRASRLQQGDFLLPRIPNTVIEFVDESEPEPVVVDGKELERIDRTYLLFPQRAGALTLPAPVFSSRTLFLEGEPLTLDVRPPASPIQPWLPAYDLTLEEEWFGAASEVAIGDHLVRRVHIRARGLTGAQLPVPFAAKPEGAKVQMIENRVDQHLEDADMVGERFVRWLYIPNRAGALSLPALELGWWDLQADAERLARLPPRALHVEGSASLPVAPTPSTRIGSPSGKVSTEQSFPWGPVAVLMLVAGLVTIFPWKRAWDRLCKGLALHRARREIMRACDQDDPRALALALHHWAGLRWGQRSPRNLREIGRALGDARIARALDELDRTLFGAEGSSSADGICTGIRKGLREAGRKRRDADRASLPPLYPSAAAGVGTDAPATGKRVRPLRSV